MTFTSVSSTYDGVLQMVTNLGAGEDESILEQEMNAVPIQRGVERAVRSNVDGVEGTFRIKLGSSRVPSLYQFEARTRTR